MLERVVETGVPIVHFGGERIPTAQLIRWAGDEERKGRAQARDEIPLAIPVVGEEVVVVLLGHGDRRRHRGRPALSRRRQEPQQLKRIGPNRWTGARGEWS